MTDLLTEEQAAQRLLISPNTLRQIRKDGGITYVALSARRIAYRSDDLEAYVSSRLRIEEARPLPKAKGRRRSVSGNRPGGNVVPFSQRRKG